jgi:hypothetical protein
MEGNKTEEQKRKFKGVWIPREIWLNKNLSITEKCLLTEIDSLDNENGCTAGNKYFADFFTISTRQVSKYIAGLEKKGLLKTCALSRNKRRIVMELKFRPDRTKVPSADRTKVPHSNTVNNTKNIIINNFKNNDGEREMINTDGLRKLRELKDRGFKNSPMYAGLKTK